MARMNAAVVTSFAEPPHYQQFEVPRPGGADEALVDVLAVGLHPRVRSGAAGAHYTSTGTLPMPGIDAVGRRPDGKRIYFVAADDVIGTMADKAVASPRRSIELPDDADAAKVAAAMNPAMSSWVALRRRVPIQPGQSVLVLGATGNAGAMAVQVARRLGAGRVVGAGRDTRPAPRARRSRKRRQRRRPAHRRPRGHRQRARHRGRRIQHRPGLPLGPARPAGDRRAAHRAIGPRSRAGLDPDRRGRRSRDRAAVSSPALGQLPPPGQRPGRRLSPGLPGRAALSRRRD